MAAHPNLSPQLHNIRIWQQNLNTSHIAQLTLTNTLCPSDWDVIALQEPAINKLGNTRANSHWRVVYPTAKYTNGAKPRAVTLINSNISTNAWQQIDFPSADVVIVQLTTSKGHCTIFNIYNDCKHDNTISAIEQFLPGNLATIRPDPQDHMIWLGDFNRHHPLWDDSSNSHLFTSSALTAAQKLIDLLADYGLIQILPRNKPTLQSSSSKNWTRPDNTFCTEHTCSALMSCDTDPGRRGPNTDHLPILTHFDLSLEQSDQAPSWNYREVDWKAFNATLDKALAKIAPPQSVSTADEFQTLARHLDEALRSTVESCVPRSRPHPHQKRWWTKDLSCLSEELKHLRKLAYKFRAIPTHECHKVLKEKEKHLDREIHTAKETHWREWLEGMADNDIWIASKYLTNPGGDGGKTRMPTLRSKDQQGRTVIATSNEEKSEVLARSLFPPPPQTSSVPLNHRYPTPAEKWTEITLDQLMQAINKLSPYKAPGPDGIANIVFQRCRQLTDYLLPLFNAAVQLQTHYEPWKESITVILRKPGKPDYSAPKAYRPIALLNTTAKLLSAIMADRTAYILETHSLLPATHFGGRPGRTTEDSLHLLETTVRNAWRVGKVASALFLDIEGAFPNAVTDRLLHNMKCRRLPSEIVEYTRQLLTGRKTRLRFDDYISEWFEITNGIGQGDPLSMILYIIYDSDLVDIAKKSKGELVLAFVDDTVLIAVAKTFQETHAILHDMLERREGAYDWSSKHNSKFETSKFGLLDFTLSKSKERPPIVIRGITIKPSTSHKFLGVMVDQELRWKEHASYALAKGMAYVALLRRISTSAHGVSPKLIRQLYRSIAVPKMLYAASVWLKPIFSAGSQSLTRGSQGIVKKLTQVQRSAAITITGVMRTSPTDSTEIHANLMPMSTLVQKILFNSSIRMASLPETHPLHGTVSRAMKRNVMHHKTALHHLLHRLKLKPDSTETIFPRPLHPASLTPFATDIASSKEDAEADFQKCEDRTMVFTDGSCHNGLVGAAASLFIDKELKTTLRYHLGKATEHTVFEAEAVGLILAAQLISQSREATFPASIYADNQAAVRSCIRPTARPGHYLLTRFRKLMQHVLDKKHIDENAISIKWIAGHTGNWGNELADREAKIAATHADNTSSRRRLPTALKRPLPSSISALKQYHNSSLLSMWARIWRQSPRYHHMASIDPSLPSNAFTKLTKPIGKKHAAIYAQLRMGHVPLNKHLYRIKKSDTPICLQCEDNKPENVHHFLFECRKYDRERHILRIKLGRRALSIRNLLASRQAQKPLFKYINETKRLAATFGDVLVRQRFTADDT